MIRINVRNFQSIAQSVVEVDGLTVITGPNNSGKTALMRAVRGVFTNAKGSSFVRHGTDACEVGVEFADGNEVVWEKGKNVNRYTVNGKLLDKVGQGVPDEVEALGITSITAGNQTVWPQIAPQFTGQVFLLDQPGSVLAEALADVERVGKLSRALKAVESDKRQAASEMKVRLSDRKALAAEMAAFDGLDAALTETLSVERAHDSLIQSRDRLTELSDLRDRHAGLDSQVKTLSGITQVGLPTQGEAQKLEQHSQELGALLRLRNRLSAAQVERDRYAGADKLACPDLPGLNLQSQLAGLLPLKAQWDTAKASHDVLAGFVVPDLDLGKTEKVAKALDILAGLKGQKAGHLSDLDGLQRELLQTQQELQLVEGTVREILDQLPACPTCGNSHAGCQ